MGSRGSSGSTSGSAGSLVINRFITTNGAVVKPGRSTNVCRSRTPATTETGCRDPRRTCPCEWPEPGRVAPGSGALRSRRVGLGRGSRQVLGRRAGQPPPRRRLSSSQVSANTSRSASSTSARVTANKFSERRTEESLLEHQETAGADGRGCTQTCCLPVCDNDVAEARCLTSTGLARDHGDDHVGAEREATTRRMSRARRRRPSPRLRTSPT